VSERLANIEATLVSVSEMMQLVIGQVLDPWDRIARSSRSSNPPQTVKVKDFYGIQSKFYCQVLGQVQEDAELKKMNQPTVKNAHLWPQHTGGNGTSVPSRR